VDVHVCADRSSAAAAAATSNKKAELEKAPYVAVESS